jgi:predicted membrane metal-binding protein
MAKPLKKPTDRSFGFTFAAVFAIAGAWLMWRGSRYGLPALGIAVVFAAIALVAARLLHPLNVVWMHFGLLLNKIVSPIVLGVIFFGIFAPIGLFFRITGRDALRRSFERGLPSYWIDRTPPGPDGKSFPRQF